MTFSEFVKLLHQYDGKNRGNGVFVLDLIEYSLEPIPEESDLESYNPIESEENARKYFDGTRKISRENYGKITQHYYRDGFLEFLGEIIDNDDKVRILSYALQKEYPNANEDNVEEICAEIFERIIATCDEEYVSKKARSKENPDQAEFRKRVFNVLSKVIKTEDWPIRSSKNKIYENELYYLPVEDREEMFDIAIENYNNKNPSPTLKILFKCKKSALPISTDDITLFFDKVQDVIGCNKAIFVSNSSFEKDAIHYAEKKGIGLIRIFDNEKINWMAPRQLNEKITSEQVESSKSEIEKALTENDYEILNNYAVCKINGTNYSDIANLLINMAGKDFFSFVSNFDLFSNDDIIENPPYLEFRPVEELIRISGAALEDIYGNKWEEITKVELKDLMRYIKDKFGFSISFGELPKTTFAERPRGYVDYKNKFIYIDRIYGVELNLIKFSIAHELSHLILHEDLLKLGNFAAYYFSRVTKESCQMETQANMLANFIILPDGQFKKEFAKIVNEFYLTKKFGHYLYLDNQRCNIQQYMLVTERLKDVFSVSREHIKNRMINLGWLEVGR